MTATHSIRATLQRPAFRGLLGSSAIYFIGNAMQATAASWLMVELTGSSFLAALVQTAVFLPMFLLSLPAGVLADTTDRRRLILSALLVQIAIVTLLAALLIAGWAGPSVLLFFTFIAGCCTALFSPAWNSTVAETVPREDMPQAITAIGMAWNSARAIGPALAGLAFAALGPGWVFAIAVLSAGVMYQAIRRWPPRQHPATRLPPERMWGGMLSALRFARHSPLVFAQLLRTVAYAGTGSALWALLPVIAQRQLGTGAAGFGLLMGCMGVGAVAAGFFLGRLRMAVGIERLVAACCLIFAAVMAIAALVRVPAIVYAALVIGGGAWMGAMSTFNTATQTSAPPWVRSRAAALHTVSSLGSFALGSALWGALSDVVGLQAALCIAAVGLAGGVLLARRFPLRMGEARDVTPGTPWEELFVVAEPGPDDGPVAVEVGYRVRAEVIPAFLDAITQLRAPRRRDGATFWRIYRDLADPTRYVERFIVTSWADYLHQRARATVADQALEAQVREHLVPGEAVTMQHYIAER